VELLKRQDGPAAVEYAVMLALIHRDLSRRDHHSGREHQQHFLEHRRQGLPGHGKLSSRLLSHGLGFDTRTGPVT